MGTSYHIVNRTKKERVSFLQLPVRTLREIVGNPVSASVVSWYFAMNPNDKIQFLPEHETDSKIFESFADVTSGVVSELVANGILLDEGKTIFDESEPDVYVRKLKNIWMEES